MSSKIGKIMKPEVISLLIAMDHVYDNNEFDYDSVAINEFEIWLASVFHPTKEVIEQIASLPTDLFTNPSYFTNHWEQNPMRIQIVHDMKKQTIKYNVWIEKQALLDNIKLDPKLILYYHFKAHYDSNFLLAVVMKNPKSILYIPKEWITEEWLISFLERSIYPSLILDGVTDMDEFEDAEVYQARATYLKNKEIADLVTDRIRAYVSEDITHYIHVSERMKNEEQLAREVLKRDPSYLCYCGDAIYHNKEIMIEMVRQNKKNAYYLPDELKLDPDILSFL